MQHSSVRHAVVASILLSSFSLPLSTPAHAARGIVPRLGSKLSGILKPPSKIVGTVLETGGSAVSSVVKTGEDAVSVLAKSDGGKNKSLEKKDDKNDTKVAESNTSEKTKPYNHKSVGRNFPTLQGEVSTYQAHTTVSKSINSLLDAGLANDERTASLDKAVNHYSKLSSKLLASASNSLNFAVPNRGFNPSIEAGNIATGESLQVKSLAAADFAKQKQVDDLHVKVVGSVMQLATGLGYSDKVKGQQKIEIELTNLQSLVGEEEANKALIALKEWSSQVKVSELAFNQEAWDVNEQRNKKLTVMTTALNSDPVVADVMGKLHKYNHRSKFARVSSRVVQTTLGTIALGPDFVGIGGKVALGAFVAATGGPEQDKIMKEMYMGERLDSRSNVLTSEIQMAMENYQLGKLTKNAVLMAAAEAVIQQMAGPELLPEVFGYPTETSANSVSAGAVSKPTF